MNALVIALILALLAPAAALAQTCSRQSPPHTLALLELYTSEGCDSCPPADRFVSSLRAGRMAGLGSDQLVPLSLHVDYWDYIGWKDRFAQAAFGGRQRWLVELARSRRVYTPEIFVGGQELRNWSDSLPAAVQRINARPARADIGIVLGKAGSGGLLLEVSVRAMQDASLFVALYENALSSEVRAGENRGVTLKHDQVVRELIGPIALKAAGSHSVKRTLRLPPGAEVGNLGVATFVQTEHGEVLQALALPVCAR